MRERFERPDDLGDSHNSNEIKIQSCKGQCHTLRGYIKNLRYELEILENERICVYQ